MTDWLKFNPVLGNVDDLNASGDLVRADGLFRVIWGMHVLLDPKNAIVDPDLGHLELHPRFAGEEEETP